MLNQEHSFPVHPPVYPQEFRQQTCRIYNLNAKIDAGTVELDNEQFVIGNLLSLAREVMSSEYKRYSKGLAATILIYNEVLLERREEDNE